MSFGAPSWLAPALGLGIVALVVVLISYLRTDRGPRMRAASVCKLLGIWLCLFCLTEPMMHHVRAQPGANRVLLLVDDSKSMQRVDGGGRSSADQVRTALAPEEEWLVRLGQDFDLRRYAFDVGLRSFEDAGELTFSGRRSDLLASIERLAERGQDRPVASMIVISDGLSTEELGD